MDKGIRATLVRRIDENPAMTLPLAAGCPPLPPIPGCAWRPLTEQDAPAYARLREACRAADGGTEVTTDEIAGRELTDPHAPLVTNTACLAAADGELLAFARVRERLDGVRARRVFLWGLTHPERRGRGIGTALVSWAEARGREILAACPADLPRLLETFHEEAVADATELYRRRGFQQVRWYRDMRRDLREPIPPEPDLGSLRTIGFEPAWTEPLRLAHNEAFADHWGSEPLPPDVFERDLVGDPLFRRDLSFLVLHGDEVAGYTLNYVAEADWAVTGVRDGWIGQLGVRRPWRKRGVATALLVRSMTAFRAAGLEMASLGVDTENPTGAVGVYERVGFRPWKQFVRLAKSFDDAPGAEGDGPGLLIRPARPDEHARLGELTVAAYRALDALEGSGYVDQLRAVERRAREAVVLTAIDGASGTPLGCVTYVPGPESPWAELLGPGEASIRMLAVDPAAQGRGAGTALVRACIDRARADGRTRLVLHSRPMMTAAQRIYGRLGFRRDEPRDWEPVPGVLLLAFALDLEPPPEG